jgi:hypothetical protein
MTLRSDHLCAWVISLGLVSGPVALAAQAQSPIEAAVGGVYSLPAKSAELSEASVQYNAQNDLIEQWRNRKDRAIWKINNSTMGDYDVAVTWSVAEQDALQGYNIEIDDRATIRAFTVNTGGSMKREVVGRIMLAPGVHTVTFFPSADDPRGGLCKLKQIELTPVAALEATSPLEPVELHVPEGSKSPRLLGGHSLRIPCWPASTTAAGCMSASRRE